MEPFENIQGVVFDFDGTLVDASIPIVRSFNIALEQTGLPVLDENDIRKLIGRPLAEMFRTVAPDASDSLIDELFARYRTAFKPISVELSKPMPGMEQLLDALPSSIKLGIATSRISDGAVHILEAMKYLERFDAIVGLEHVQRPKPDPEPVWAALRIMGVEPASALMVGDVPDDMRAGRNAGAQAVGLSSEIHTPDILYAAGANRVIARLDELIPLVAASS